MASTLDKRVKRAIRIWGDGQQGYGWKKKFGPATIARQTYPHSYLNKPLIESRMSIAIGAHKLTFTYNRPYKIPE